MLNPNSSYASLIREKRIEKREKIAATLRGNVKARNGETVSVT